MFHNRLFCASLAITIFLAACGPAELRPAGPQPLPSPSDSWSVSLTQSGGFAGVLLKVQVSSDGQLVAEDSKSGRSVTQHLPPETLAKLASMLSTVFLATPGSPHTGCADCFLYDLDISSGASAVHTRLDDTMLAASGAEELIRLLAQLRDSALKNP
jgi:hypothetical protein